MAAKRVLVVEDDGIVRYLLAEALLDVGYEVVDVADGDTAVKKLNYPDDFDVLVTDVQIPGSCDGLEVVEYARHAHPKIGVVIVSGYAASLTERLAKTPKPFQFLSKPYRITQLIELITQEAA
ncbi:response regulator [Acidisoma silvae]|uniref:Response regulator n=1 Tax=Acidisoma silvae TaxID=2802396 RepID=A0A963YYK6_9PROT|nr:response regulator [Acidisoma silvae]MCB8878588.1 response regulator [Acidisoma silvae]